MFTIAGGVILGIIGLIIMYIMASVGFAMMRILWDIWASRARRPPCPKPATKIYPVNPPAGPNHRIFSPIGHWKQTDWNTLIVFASLAGILIFIGILTAHDK